ncbi:hypothetical protein [Limosilactobacillus reuteri]|uniref:hypothetical protein n=1 Tax=Limosilactobacillus reuteri TaxID=1598 RepID=UPI00129BB569|nr:hypothetical protein [Limosilactobacillus reuteri]MRI08722.1 hypothetical protein [Limosilactobacillus reuteri]
MADFKRVVITRDGQKLMSDIMAKKKQLEFTKIIISEDSIGDIQDKDKSDVNYASEDVRLDFFQNANQEIFDLQVHALENFGGMTNPAVEVIANVDNTQLTKGYYMRTLGLCAEDNSGNEILYAYTYADRPGYMPPYNGKTTSGAMFKIIVTVGNTDQVTLLQGSGYASSYEVDEMQKQLNELKGVIGYTENDIFGLEADFDNNIVTRLAGAKNRTPGASFDGLGPWKRRRCILAEEDGQVLAYYGEPGYITTGSLSQEITKNGKTYPVGTRINVMVEQPKFYYRVVPLKIEKKDGGGVEIHKARYYISSMPYSGFKIHPAFENNGKERDVIYLSAFLASISSDTAKTMSNKIVSVAGASPYHASDVNGLANIVNMPNYKLNSIKTIDMTCLLIIIEYAKFDVSAIFPNAHDLPYFSVTTGVTSGNATQINREISYRGEEGLGTGIVFADMNIHNAGITYESNSNQSVQEKITFKGRGIAKYPLFLNNADWMIMSSPYSLYANSNDVFAQPCDFTTFGTGTSNNFSRYSLGSFKSNAVYSSTCARLVYLPRTN